MARHVSLAVKFPRRSVEEEYRFPELSSDDGSPKLPLRLHGSCANILDGFSWSA